MDDRPADGSSPLPELLGAAVGGAWMLAGGDPLSGGLVTAGVATAVRLDVDNMRRRLQRSASVLEGAALQLGGLSRLEALAAADDARLELTARVLEAAARTTVVEKLSALSSRMVSSTARGLTRPCSWRPR